MKSIIIIIFAISQFLNAQETRTIKEGKDPLIVFYQQSLEKSYEYLVDDSYVFGRIHLLYTNLRISLEKDSGVTGFIHPHLMECNDIECERFKEVILQTFIINQFSDNKGFAIYLVNPFLDDSWITFEVDYNDNNSTISTRYYYSLNLCLKENLSEDIYENSILKENQTIDIEPVEVHSLHQIAFIESLFTFYLEKAKEENFIKSDLCNLSKLN